MTEWTKDLEELAKKHGWIKEVELFKRPRYLAGLGEGVKTVFDIGVSSGTRALYVAFSECDFVLVDPQRGGEEIMRYRPEKPYKYVHKGLASQPGRLVLNDNVARSSFLARTALSVEPLKDRYEAEVTTFRDLVAEMKPTPPYGVKIDTEGYELEVIKGMEGCFSDIRFIVCETSIRKLFEGGYQFSDLVAHLRDRGFMFYNFLNHPKSSPRFYDSVFLPKDHPLFS